MGDTAAATIMITRYASDGKFEATELAQRGLTITGPDAELTAHRLATDAQGRVGPGINVNANKAPEGGWKVTIATQDVNPNLHLSTVQLLPADQAEDVLRRSANEILPGGMGEQIQPYARSGKFRSTELAQRGLTVTGPDAELVAHRIATDAQARLGPGINVYANEAPEGGWKVTVATQETTPNPQVSSPKLPTAGQAEEALQQAANEVAPGSMPPALGAGKAALVEGRTAAAGNILAEDQAPTNRHESSRGKPEKRPRPPNGYKYVSEDLRNAIKAALSADDGRVMEDAYWRDSTPAYRNRGNSTELERRAYGELRNLMEKVDHAKGMAMVKGTEARVLTQAAARYAAIAAHRVEPMDDDDPKGEELARQVKRDAISTTEQLMGQVAAQASKFLEQHFPKMDRVR
jgi:hypothetical protein